MTRLNRISADIISILMLASTAVLIAGPAGLVARPAGLAPGTTGFGDYRHITGVYGEYRGNHLHMGFDFSTDGLTGRPVYAPVSGSIVRVKSAKGGDGNAVYLQSDAGPIYIFVHLDRFGNDRLNRYLRPLGGADIDVFPDPVVPGAHPGIKVAAGDLIGYSGESGSGPPHLHVEIRNDFTAAINPLKSLAPPPMPMDLIIDAIVVYPIGNPTGSGAKGSLVVGRASPLEIKYSGGTLPEIKFCGRIGIGIRCRYQTGRGDNLTPGSWSIKTSEGRVFTRSFERISYDDNAHAARFYDANRSGFGPTWYTPLFFARAGSPKVSLIPEIWDGIIDESVKDCALMLADVFGNQTEITLRFAVDTAMKFETQDSPYTIEGWDGTYLIKCRSLMPPGLLLNDQAMKSASFIRMNEHDYYCWLDPEIMDPGAYQLKIIGNFGKLIRSETVWYVVADRQPREITLDEQLTLTFPADAVFAKTGMIIRKIDSGRQPAAEELALTNPGYQPLLLYDFKKNITVTQQITGRSIPHLAVFSFNDATAATGYYSSADSGLVRFSTRMLRPWILARDNGKPVIGNGYFKSNDIFAIEALDRGSGINEASIRVSVGGAVVTSEYDADRRLILCAAASLKPGRKVNVAVSDRTGNQTKKTIVIKR